LGKKSTVRGIFTSFGMRMDNVQGALFAGRSAPMSPFGYGEGENRLGDGGQGIGDQVIRESKGVKGNGKREGKA
jgi:hypothetical protein